MSRWGEHWSNAPMLHFKAILKYSIVMNPNTYTEEVRDEK